MYFVQIDAKYIMCKAALNHGFIDIGTPRHIWAIPAIHSAADNLTDIHNNILNQIKPGDRILYHGNYTGFGDMAIETIDEILAFRRIILSISGMRPSDFIYLKGVQEEMLSKLLQLQFAPNPDHVMLWMLGNGLQATLNAYGICSHDGIDACRHGVMGLTKWTQSIRNAIREHAGHEDFMLAQSRAAHTDIKNHASPLLFVHAGLNIGKTLHEQGDSLWWETQNFDAITSAYQPFQKVVRGYDPAHKGLYLNCVTATLDNGCGFGGDLICAQFGTDGQVANIIQ